MSRDVYRRLMQRELSSDELQEVKNFPHSHILRLITLILSKSSIAKEESNRVLNAARKHTEPCSFYIIPKLHNKTLKSRPITAAHSYILNYLSRQLSNELMKVVKRYPAITVNRKQFVRQIEQIKIPKDYWLFPYDVSRMYPSIETQDAIRKLCAGLPNFFKYKNCYWKIVLHLIMHYKFVTANNQV